MVNVKCKVTFNVLNENLLDGKIIIMFLYDFHVTTYNNQKTIVLTTYNDQGIVAITIMDIGGNDSPLLSNMFLI